MDVGKHLSARLVCHLFVCSSLLYTSTATCTYSIQHLARQSVSPTDKEIYSTMDIGTNVFTVTVISHAEHTYVPTNNGIVMITSSSNYDLIYVDDDHHEFAVKNCLQIGYKEYLAFSLNDTLLDADCGVWILETYVEPSKPNFTIPSSLDVGVSTCLPDIDVIELQFHNGGNCSSWNCSANCTNDDKIFWTEGRTVRTSFNNTSFNMTYGIRLTCFDDKAGSAIDDTTGEAMIKVTFVDAGSMDSCAETTVTTPTTMSTMSTMSNQGVIQQKECVGFFQSPVNIALLAFFGGVFVGIPSGVVIYLAAKRYACKSSAVGNGVK